MTALFTFGMIGLAALMWRLDVHLERADDAMDRFALVGEALERSRAAHPARGRDGGAS